MTTAETDVIDVIDLGERATGSMVEEIMGSTLLKMGRKGVFCIFGDSLSPSNKLI